MSNPRNSGLGASSNGHSKSGQNKESKSGPNKESKSGPNKESKSGPSAEPQNDSLEEGWKNVDLDSFLKRRGIQGYEVIQRYPHFEQIIDCGVSLKGIRLGSHRDANDPEPSTLRNLDPLIVFELCTNVTRSDDNIILQWSLKRPVDIFWLRGFQLSVHHGIVNDINLPTWRDLGVISRKENIHQYECEIKGFRKDRSFTIAISAIGMCENKKLNVFVTIDEN